MISNLYLPIPNLSLPIAGVADHCARKTFEKDFGQIIITATANDLLFGGIKLCRRFEDDFAAFNETNNLCSLVNNFVCTEALERKNIIRDGDDLVFSFLGYVRPVFFCILKARLIF